MLFWYYVILVFLLLMYIREVASNNDLEIVSIITRPFEINNVTLHPLRSNMSNPIEPIVSTDSSAVVPTSYPVNSPAVITTSNPFQPSPQTNNHVVVPTSNTGNTQTNEIKTAASELKRNVSIQLRLDQGGVICEEGFGGFANYMFGWLSCYAISILMNKQMFFGDGVTFYDHFTVLSIKHTKIKRRSSRIFADRSYTMVDHCASRRCPIFKQLSEYDIHSVFPGRVIKLATNCPLFAWVLANEANYNRFVQLGFLPAVPYNSCDLSVHGFRLMSFIMKNYFVFSDDIRKVVAQNSKTWSNQPSVGMHIRRGKSDGFNEDSGHVFLNYDDVTSFMNCQFIGNLSNPIIYLISDSDEMKKRAMKVKGNYPVVTSPIHARHYGNDRSLRRSMILRDNLVDILTIASCDYIIGTKESTFTLLAAALQGNIPYLVGKGDKCSLSNIVFPFSVCSIIS